MSNRKWFDKTLAHVHGIGMCSLRFGPSPPKVKVLVVTCQQLYRASFLEVGIALLLLLL